MKPSEPLLTVTLNGKTYSTDSIVEVTWDEDLYESYIRAEAFDVETDDGIIHNVEWYETDNSTWELLLDFIDCM